MRKYLLLLAAAAALCLPAAAQTLTVSGSSVTDSSGTPLANGTIIWAPVDLQGRPLPYRKGGGGQALSKPVTATVSNGAFSLPIADTSRTSPINVCFAVSVIDAVTGRSVLGQGYTCVQPSSTATWCTATSCNFDNYVPSTPGLTPTATGPVGPSGDSATPEPLDYFYIGTGTSTLPAWRQALTSDIGVAQATVTIGDADATLSSDVQRDDYIAVLSNTTLTAVRTLSFTATNGQPLSVSNYTAGAQPISVCAQIGACVTIQNGDTDRVRFDGSKMVQENSDINVASAYFGTINLGTQQSHTSFTYSTTDGTLQIQADGGTGSAEILAQRLTLGALMGWDISHQTSGYLLQHGFNGFDFLDQLSDIPDNQAAGLHCKRIQATSGQGTSSPTFADGLDICDNPAAAAPLVSLPGLKATSGTRFVCVDTNGVISSSATACSGT